MISDNSGRNAVFGKTETFGLDLSHNNPEVQELLESLKTLENEGYQFEGAEGSFELLVRKAMGTIAHPLNCWGVRIIVEKRKTDEESISEATVMVKVGEVVEHTAAVGEGPVNALDHALRKALGAFLSATTGSETSGL